LTVALIGNPNVGKTELFNRLTGMKQQVGNWPGVTVEKKTGKFTHRGDEMEVVDLPGTYSLTAQAADELVSRRFIVEERPDVVVNILDATSLERNLYLTLLLLELEANLVLALNKWDMARERGIAIDVERLSQLLGAAAVPTVATTGEGLEELKEAVSAAAKADRKRRRPIIGYGDRVESAIGDLEEAVSQDPILSERYPSRWLSIKLLEDDAEAKRLVEESPRRDEILGRLERYGR
jgi:ferrous iron transport protein B